MIIIEELKRRKVFRVAASYAVVAFVIMQLVEILFPMFNFPQWTQQFIVIVLLLGFPIAVILSWVFDKTPEGLVKTASNAEVAEGSVALTDTRPFYLKKRNIFLVVGVAAGVMIGLFGGSAITGSQPDEKSIAVLPFDNFSQDPADDYFSDGITEDITMNLAKIGELTVISRTSVMEYKNSTKKVKQIAEELGVKYILEGSIRKMGDRVRVVGQLIDAENDKHVWADSYDREMTDLFAIQADVAKNIADALEATLTEKTFDRIAAAPTTNIEAYNLYLKGRQAYNEYTYDDFKRGIDYFNHALKIDPFYAVAYAGLADSYAQLYTRDHKGINRDLSAAAVEKALSINPESAEAYKALLQQYQGHYSEGLKNDMKALELNPGYSVSVANIGVKYSRMGDYSASLEYFLRFAEMDPKHRYANSFLASVYRDLGLEDRAKDVITVGLKVVPDSYELRNRLFEIALHNGNMARAIEIIEEIEHVRPGDIRVERLRGDYHYFNGDLKTALKHFELHTGRFGDKLKKVYCMLHAGDKNQAKKLIEENEKNANDALAEGDQSYRVMMDLVYVSLMKGEIETALGNLEEAYSRGARRYKGWGWLTNPAFAPMRGHPRFQAILDKIDRHVEFERIQAGLAS